MNKEPHNPMNLQELRSVLSGTNTSDFAGDTGFVRLTPSEKLDALAAMCVFVHEFKGKAKEQG